MVGIALAFIIIWCGCMHSENLESGAAGCLSICRAPCCPTGDIQLPGEFKNRAACIPKPVPAHGRRRPGTCHVHAGSRSARHRTAPWKPWYAAYGWAGWVSSMLLHSSRAVALGVMLVGLPTAHAADSTLTLACQGTTTAGTEGKPEPVSMGIIVSVPRSARK